MGLDAGCKCEPCTAERRRQEEAKRAEDKYPANDKDKEILQLKAEVERLNGMIDFNEEQYDECCRDCHIMLEGENKKLKGDLKEAEEHIELLQDKLHKVEKELKRLQQENEDLHQRIENQAESLRFCFYQDKSAFDRGYRAAQADCAKDLGNVLKRYK